MVGTLWACWSVGVLLPPGSGYSLGASFSPPRSGGGCLTATSATVWGLARGLACTSAPLGAPSWGVWLRGVAMSYFCDIACCKIIVSRPIRNCKSNFVPTCSIFAPAHSTFISHVFYTENRRIPGAQNCNYIIRCCTQFFIAIPADLWYNTSATERRETHGEGWFW